MNETRLFRIRRFDIKGGAADPTTYLRRWSLQLPRGRSLKLHVFLRPDADACLHDHPWPFCTLVLWGGYVERTPDGDQEVLPGRLYSRPAAYRHTITRLRRRLAVTIVLTGPWERRWGFYTAKGWMHWKNFVNHPLRALWCRDE